MLRKMRQVTVRELQINPSDEFDNLPFEVTRYGRVVAVVSLPGEKINTQKAVAKMVEKARKISGVHSWVCSHGFLGRLCKHEGCRREAIKREGQ